MSKYIIITFIFIVIFCSIYFFRFQAINKNEQKANIDYIIRGRVSSIKKISDYKMRLLIGDIQVETPFLDNLYIGDRVEVIGKLETKVINRFYSQLWLITKDIKPIAQVENEPLFSKWYWWFLKHINMIKTKAEGQFFQFLPNNEAALLSGIVLGSQENFSQKLYQNLRLSGTLHIAVASGMNVVIIGKLVMDLLGQKLKRSLTVFIILLCILIYTFLAGAQAPIVRAAIMGGLAFIAQVLGKKYWAVWGLILSGGVMLLIKPDLLFQIGFQLSFAATAGLIFLSPVLSAVIIRSLSKLPHILTGLAKIFEANLTETVSAQLAVLPLLFYHFGSFNLLSFLPNILIAPVIPLLMQFGGLILAFSWPFSLVGQIFSWLAWAPLAYVNLVVAFFGSNQLLNITASFSWLAVFVYWIFCFYLLAKGAFNGRKK